MRRARERMDASTSRARRFRTEVQAGRRVSETSFPCQDLPAGGVAVRSKCVTTTGQPVRVRVCWASGMRLRGWGPSEHERTRQRPGSGGASFNVAVLLVQALLIVTELP